MDLFCPAPGPYLEYLTKREDSFSYRARPRFGSDEVILKEDAIPVKKLLFAACISSAGLFPRSMCPFDDGYVGTDYLHHRIPYVGEMRAGVPDGIPFAHAR